MTTRGTVVGNLMKSLEASGDEQRALVHTPPCTRCGSHFPRYRWRPEMRQHHPEYKVCADCAARQWDMELRKGFTNG